MKKQNRELTGKEKRQIKKLVVSLCANYDKEYGCLPLDCDCYMFGICYTNSALCKYFQSSVIPNDAELEAVFNGTPITVCKQCGKPITLTCKCYGKTFEAKRSNTPFCPPNCRAKFYRQEAAENRSRECVCENCGVAFTTTRTDVKYCCDDCRVEANRKKMRMERYAAMKAAKAEPVLQEIPSVGNTEQKQKTA